MLLQGHREVKQVLFRRTRTIRLPAEFAVLAPLIMLYLMVVPGAAMAQTPGGPPVTITQAWARDAVARALVASAAVDDSFLRAQTLAEIAEVQAAGGHAAAARETLQQAEFAAAGVDADALASWAKHDIGIAYAKAGDLAKAESLAGSVGDIRLRDEMLVAVVDVYRNTPDMERALATARHIADSVRQGQSLRAIAIMQANVGDLTGALQTARSIGHGGGNALALGDVAVAIAKDGDLEGARSIALRIGDAPSRARAFAEIAVAQARAGNVGAALESVAQVRDKLLRGEALGRVAAARASFGADADARELFAQAFAAVKSGRGDANRMCAALAEIAQAQIGAGDNSGAADTLRRAIASLRRVRRGSDRMELLGRVAPLQARAGDYAGALATAMRVQDPSLRPLLVRDIAAVQAAAGDVAGAVAAVHGLPERETAAAALFGILRAQSRARDTSGMRETIDVALQVVRQVRNPELRAGALGSLAAALSSAGDVDAARSAFAESMSAAAGADTGQQQAAAYVRIADALAERRGAPVD